jgi:2-polyprenyl-3-methyl-5-hydroxy-6-metoxy-1,4-benzoquinol methylase
MTWSAWSTRSTRSRRNYPTGSFVLSAVPNPPAPLNEEQLRYLQTVSPGATSIAAAVSSLHEEMEAIGGSDMRKRFDADLHHSFRRSSGEDLGQAAVSGLFASPDYFVSNALNNLQKISQPERAHLRMRALEEMAAHKDMTVLDFGCGSGAQLLGMRALGCRGLWAAEVDDGLLQFVSDRLHHRFGERPRTWNILREQGPARTFGAALVLDVFTVIADPAATIRQVAATLLPGAALVCNLTPISDALRRNWNYAIGAAPADVLAGFQASGFTRRVHETIGTDEFVVLGYDG